MILLLNRRKARIYRTRGKPEGLYWSARYRYGPYYLLALSFGISLALTVHIILSGVYAGREKEGALGVVLVFILFSTIAYIAFILTVRPPPRISSGGIERTKFSGRSVLIPWSDVQSVYYSDLFFTAYVIRTGSGKISLNTGLDGLSEFLAEIHAKAPLAPFMDRSLNTLTKMAFSRRKKS